MKTVLTWTAGIALSCCAYGAHQANANVDFGFRGISSETALRVKDECFGTLTMLQQWGWQVTPIAGKRVEVLADGQRITLGTSTIGGSERVKLTELCRQLDASGAWRQHSDIFEIRARVRVIRFVNHHLLATSSLNVQPVLTFNEQSGLQLDLIGAELSQDAVIDVDPGIRIDQVKPGHLRITTPLTHRFRITDRMSAPATDFDFNTAPPDGPGETGPIDTSPQKHNSVPIFVGPPKEVRLRFVESGASSIRLELPLPHRLAQLPDVTRVSPTMLRLTISGAKLTLPPDQELPGGVVTKATSNIQGSTTTLEIQLKRPMGLQVSTTPEDIFIQLVKPPVGNGKLAGKLIVVDPGHGGKDTGTTSEGRETLEKSIVLAVATRLADRLTSEGATVIMTRRTDIFIPLVERASIANRSQADLFISVHVNSMGRREKTRGSITFYHQQDPVCSTLADCIERELASKVEIPGIGTRSDHMIYKSGFSVLRGIKMPGVLIEMGFMSNSADRALMIQPSVQDKIAEATVRGVKTYLGESGSDEN